MLFTVWFQQKFNDSDILFNDDKPIYRGNDIKSN